MRSVTVCSRGAEELIAANPAFQTIQLNDISVTCGLLSSPRKSLENTPNGFAWVRVNAFSCSNRDKAMILRTALFSVDRGYYIIGSDFCGEVLQTGDAAGNLKPGDRVILDSSPQSLIQSRASREYQLVPVSHLVKVPRQAPVEELAGFAIAAKTAYCLIRAADVRDAANVLVTSGRSAVALAILSALQRRAVKVDVLTTCRSHDQRFMELGTRAVLHAVIDEESAGLNCQEALEQARRIGGYDAVLDPYFNTYLPSLAQVLKSRRVYASCGMGERFPAGTSADGVLDSSSRSQTSLMVALRSLLINNSELCLRTLGSSRDLDDALRDYQAGAFRVVLDQTFEDVPIGLFLTRTFKSEDRIGRVIYRYN